METAKVTGSLFDSLAARRIESFCDQVSKPRRETKESNGLIRGSERTTLISFVFFNRFSVSVGCGTEYYDVFLLSRRKDQVEIENGREGAGLLVAGGNWKGTRRGKESERAENG